MNNWILKNGFEKKISFANGCNHQKYTYTIYLNLVSEWTV